MTYRNVDNCQNGDYFKGYNLRTHTKNKINSFTVSQYFLEYFFRCMSEVFLCYNCTKKEIKSIKFVHQFFVSLFFFFLCVS